MTKVSIPFFPVEMGVNILYLFSIYFVFAEKKMSNTKLKRKAISLETKIEILDRLRNGEGSTFLGKMFGLNEATIITIKNLN